MQLPAPPKYIKGTHEHMLRMVQPLKPIRSRSKILDESISKSLSQRKEKHQRRLEEVPAYQDYKQGQAGF